MKAVGVVVEYNPFHNGHLYHLQQSKKVTKADVVIAVMSGHFLQRGEPALVGKWARAKMALRGGADLVIELPYAFSTQNAEIFANGAVSLLSALDTAYLCFGSEVGEIDRFYDLANFLQKNEKKFNERLKKEIKTGISYPKAAANAFQSFEKQQLLDLSLPNNILGFHYVKAMLEQRTKIQAMTVKRIKSGYHDPTPASSTIASATSIRNEIIGKQSLQSIERLIPVASLQLLQKEYDDLGKWVSWEDYFPFLKYKLLTSSVRELQSIYEIEEGIEQRLIRYVKKATNFHTFIKEIKTKRYTWTRLQRMCTHLLTNTKKVEMAFTISSKKASYIRLLAMSQKGQHYLNVKKKEIQLPIISTRSKHDDPSLLLDERASYIYALVFHPSLQEKIMKKEYATPPIRRSEVRGRKSD